MHRAILPFHLQRLVDGGGSIDCEYGVGRGRIDLLIRLSYTAPDGRRARQRCAFELEIRTAGKPDRLAQALAQLDT